jgi:hypothetical protein
MTERDEDWAKEQWPDDEDWPAYDPDVSRQIYLGTSPHHVSKQGRRRLIRLMTTAVVAIAAGVGGALAVKDIASGSSTPPAAQQNSAQPRTEQPNAGQGGQLPQGVSGSMVLGGQVTAVSPRSITISAGPESVTARVSGSTRFSGKVTGIAGVHIGDMVMAQISESNGVSSLVALQDPISAS